jgi:hypothetical protein
MIFLFELVLANVIYFVRRKIQYDLGMIIELIINVVNYNRVYVYYYACSYVWFACSSLWHDDLRTSINFLMIWILFKLELFSFEYDKSFCMKVREYKLVIKISRFYDMFDICLVYSML